MNYRDRQRVKEKLIELRVWRYEDLGDPTVDRFAAEKVLEVMKKRLVEGVSLWPEVNPFSTQVYIRVPREFFYPESGEDVGAENISDAIVSHRLPIERHGIAETKEQAICLAALALPDFLARHPKCEGGTAK